MDPIANPYTPGAGSRPWSWPDEAQSCAQFEILIGRLKRRAIERSMVIKGPRGVGKTVLNTFQDQAESRTSQQRAALVNFIAGPQSLASFLASRRSSAVLTAVRSCTMSGT